MTGVNRRTVDFSAYPDLVVIYLGMRVNTLTGMRAYFIGFGPQMERSVKARPGEACCYTKPSAFSFRLMPACGNCLARS